MSAGWRSGEEEPLATGDGSGLGPSSRSEPSDASGTAFRVAGLVRVDWSGPRIRVASRTSGASCSNSLRLEFVDQVFPDAKFVHIIRDGTQSVLSIYRFWKEKSRGLPTKKIGVRLKELSITRLPYYSLEVLKRVLPQGAAYWTGKPVWGPRIPGLNGLLRDLDLLEVCCLQWRMCVEAACTYGRLLPATRYMECRLEDMSPELLQRVMEFTELEDASEIWEAFEKKFDPSQPGRRTPNAEPAQIELIHKWIEPTMKWLESGNSVPSPGESSPGRG